MSGGVDSSVAAALMIEAGYDVVGVTLKQWEEAGGAMPSNGCCTLSDVADAARVAATLGIEHHVLDYIEEFTAAVVEPFGAAYLAGRTPNPCVECNRKVRFTSLFEQLDAFDADVLVTGHHARVERDDAGWHLLVAVDGTKDQSYMLHMLGRDQLARIRFPVGEMTKTEVRRRAATLGLGTADKPDSQDICFVPSGDYRDFLRRQLPETALPGPVVDRDGTVLAEHDGITGFTIGQRRGLGVAVGAARYVVDIEPAERRIVIGTYDDLLVDGCVVGDVSFVEGTPPGRTDVTVKVRYRSAPIPAMLTPAGDRWEIRFAERHPSPAPGQAAVFYDGERVLGGGTIESVIRS
jgi:tRNA-specific 2-thiouridylase